MPRILMLMIGLVVLSLVDWPWSCISPANWLKADEPFVQNGVVAAREPRVPILSSEESWKRLPPRFEPAGEPTSSPSLPIWARAFAGASPRTTAVMLEQDCVFRTSEAFDPKLRAKMRWVAARTNRCEYSQAYAAADLRRLGVSEAEIARLRESFAELPERERAALAFARQMTRDASQVTDEEFARLIEQFDEATVVAMVLQMAFANFQDRLLLALNVAVEPDGPLPPLQVRFEPLEPGEKVEPAPRPATQPMEIKREVLKAVPDTDWKAQAFEQLQLQLQSQRERQPRVGVPKWGDVHSRLPAGMYPADPPVRIKWSLVVLGYQPPLGVAWLQGLRTFGREAKQDRVLEESMFWVITRSLQCFY